MEMEPGLVKGCPYAELLSGLTVMADQLAICSQSLKSCAVTAINGNPSHSCTPSVPQLHFLMSVSCDLGHAMDPCHSPNLPYSQDKVRVPITVLLPPCFSPAIFYVLDFWSEDVRCFLSRSLAPHHWSQGFKVSLLGAPDNKLFLLSQGSHSLLCGKHNCG